MSIDSCELCLQDGGDVVLRTDRLRVVLVNDDRYPGFCRVIWNAHVREMTDLAPEDRHFLMSAVWQVEAAVREVMQPHKVNLASLGNLVPHLHWHVIPRHQDDAHFPDPIWATARRTSQSPVQAAHAAKLDRLRMTIRQRMGILA